MSVESAVPCPDCERSFSSKFGMKTHHGKMHNSTTPGKVEIVNCSWCDKDLERRTSKVSREERFFCGRECQGKWRAENEEGWAEETKVEIKCANCNTHFYRCPSEIKEEYNFCSRKCMGKWNSKNRTGKDHPNWTRKDVECENCGETVEKAKHEREGTKFTVCSKKCGWEMMSKERTEVHPENYNPEGSNYYSRSAWRQRRDEVIKRDGGECFICGLGKDEHKMVNNGGIHVHHVTEKGEYDNAEAADVISNLLTVCVTCHHRIWTSK